MIKGGLYGRLSFLKGYEMKQHTPGPWIVCPRVGHQIPVASAAMEGLLCNVAHLAALRDGEGTANANLIASAPELLSMLERFLDEYLSCDPVGGQVALLTIEQAQAAIKKAKGEI